jgi:hypothetical protein
MSSSHCTRHPVWPSSSQFVRIEECLAEGLFWFYYVQASFFGVMAALDHRWRFRPTLRHSHLNPPALRKRLHLQYQIHCRNRLQNHVQNLRFELFHLQRQKLGCPKLIQFTFYTVRATSTMNLGFWTCKNEKRILILRYWWRFCSCQDRHVRRNLL